MSRRSLPCALVLVFCAAAVVSAQETEDPRAQYPALLANSFATLNIGSVHYDFSDRQLEPAYDVGSIHVRHIAARAVLFGHHFGKYVSAQTSYMRPVKYVLYENVAGENHTVWMHFGTATLLGVYASIRASGSMARVDWASPTGPASRLVTPRL